MNIFGIEIDRDILVTAILAVGLTMLLVSWLYEHDMSAMRKKHALLEDALLDRTYDWLDQRRDNQRLREQQVWSFSDSLHRWLEDSDCRQAERSDREITAPLFDTGLMMGNQD